MGGPHRRLSTVGASRRESRGSFALRERAPSTAAGDAASSDVGGVIVDTLCAGSPMDDLIAPTRDADSADSLARRRSHRGRQVGCATTMIRGSVMSSIAKRSPSRPTPESFTPP